VGPKSRCRGACRSRRVPGQCRGPPEPRSCQEGEGGDEDCAHEQGVEQDAEADDQADLGEGDGLAAAEHGLSARDKAIVSAYLTRIAESLRDTATRE
jgi:hypothetical protein